MLINGVVYTVDDRRPKAEAFAVLHGRFLAVGSSADIRKLITRRTKVIDAAGMTVVPGFIDAHTPPGRRRRRALIDVDCDRRTIADDPESDPGSGPPRRKEGDWVIGFKYDDTKLTDGRPLTRADLDAAAPRHPGPRQPPRRPHRHLQQPGLPAGRHQPRQTPDPEGGKFGRDAKGELTGFVAEKAVDRVKKLPVADRASEGQAGVQADLAN